MTKDYQEQVSGYLTNLEELAKEQIREISWEIGFIEDGLAIDDDHKELPKLREQKESLEWLLKNKGTILYNLALK